MKIEIQVTQNYAMTFLFIENALGTHNSVEQFVTNENNKLEAPEYLQESHRENE